MADRNNIKNPEENNRRRIWGTYGGEVLAALVIIVLVVGVAFWVNKFFYGFENPQIAFTETPAQNKSEGSGKEKTGKTFKQSDDWRLILVNRDHPLEGDEDREFTELRHGQSVDSRIYPDLQAMFDEMREEGLSPLVVEGYRSNEEQKEKFESKIREYMGYGKTRDQARELALQWVAEPGTSEHETGMCVDISSDNGDNESANEVWKWLDSNCSRFGFIKRYPYDKSSITGLKGEPWHYRYVGAEAAEEIMKKGLTLEEYLGAVPQGGT